VILKRIRKPPLMLAFRRSTARRGYGNPWILGRQSREVVRPTRRMARNWNSWAYK
jgi:hypothetical protein